MRNNLIAILALVSCLGPLAPAAAQGPILTRRPYVQLGRHDSILVAWQTDRPADGAVEYGPDPSYGSRVADPALAEGHAVVLSGLASGTRYVYRVLGGGNTLAEGLQFTTDPDPATPAPPYRFIVFGDSGSGAQPQLDVAAQIALSKPDFGIHIGDVIYQGGVPRDWDPKYFRIYRDLIASVVFYPAIGNQDSDFDGGSAYLDAFYLPQNGPTAERTYSRVYANALFLSLDTNNDLSPGGAAYRWAEGELSSTDRFWKIVYFHHPIYTSAPGNTKNRANLAPLFDRYKVDLVLAGHMHYYERTFPLRDGKNAAVGQEPDYVDPPGTIYIVTGGGGMTLRTADPSEFTARYESTYHHVQIDVDGPALRLTAIDGAGDVIDRMSLRKAPPPTRFRRGDADGDGALTITDGIFSLTYLFLGGPPPDCPRTADTDDSGVVDLSDAVALLSHLFLGGVSPREPFPDCGQDPTPDALSCGSYPRCG